MKSIIRRLFGRKPKALPKTDACELVTLSSQEIQTMINDPMKLPKGMMIKNGIIYGKKGWRKS